MKRNQEDRIDAGQYSATTMQQCPRFVQLAYNNDFIESPGDYFRRFRGNMGHDLMYQLLKDEPDMIAEIRFFKPITIDGVEFEISGKPDWVLPHYQDRGLIVDFKSTNKKVALLEGITTDDHYWQANIYRWLLWGGRPQEWTPFLERYAGTGVLHKDRVFIELKGAEIDYFDMDHPKKIKVPTAPFEEVENYIRDRMEPHVEFAQTGRLAPVLPSRFYKARTGPNKGQTVEQRHWKCDRCPLRQQCDELARQGK
jgi:hypothetical protein